jgi:hypothetical protein
MSGVFSLPRVTHDLTRKNNAEHLGFGEMEKRARGRGSPSRNGSARAAMRREDGDQSRYLI